MAADAIFVITLAGPAVALATSKKLLQPNAQFDLRRKFTTRSAAS